jgi:acetyltransferase-like isoleucine patch superfamily enzyme
MFNRIKYWITCDRLGPDIPLTHLLLHHPSSMKWVCKKKFKKFGNNSEFRPGAYADNCSNISIGDNVVIRPGTMLFSEAGDDTPNIVIEDKVLIGSGVHFYVPDHKFSDSEKLIFNQGYSYKGDIVIKTGSWVGANSIILSGVKIGENSVVAAGSVVTKNVAPKVVVGGNPAKLIKLI